MPFAAASALINHLPQARRPLLGSKIAALHACNEHCAAEICVNNFIVVVFFFFLYECYTLESFVYLLIYLFFSGSLYSGGNTTGDDEYNRDRSFSEKADCLDLTDDENGFDIRCEVCDKTFSDLDE